MVELEVQQDSLILRVGQRAGISVQAFDDKGNAVLALKYRSSDEKIARVAPNGTVTGVQPGTAQVIVQAGTKSKSVMVKVVRSGPAPDTVARAAESGVRTAAAAGAVASLTIEPATIYLLPAENLRASARGLRPDGSPTGPLKVAWKSLRPDIASVVDTSGLVIGISPGQGVIAASLPGGVTATVPVVVGAADYGFATSRLVLAPQQAETLRVTVPSQQSRELRNIDLQWRTTDASIVRVGPTGIAEAVSPGKAEVVITGFLQERRLPAVVHREVVALLLWPDPKVPVQVPLLGSRKFNADPKAADSSLVTDAPLEWSIEDTSVASFDPATRVLRSRKLGTTTLILRLHGFKPSIWTVNVVAGRVGLDPSRMALRPGARQKIAVTLFDSSGKAVGAATDVRWTTSDPAVAKVLEDGTVQAGGLGAATITAALGGGESATARVFVAGDVLVSSTRGTGRLGLYDFLLRNPADWRPILIDSATNLQATYSPDRMRLAFSSDRAEAGNVDIYTADPDGQNIRRLTTEPGLDNGVAWTPDGQQILFTSLRTKVSQIFIMNSDGSDVRRLTNSSGGNWDPVASPDGKTVAFTSARDDNAEIYAMDLTGGGQTNLTLSRDRNESSPHFLPNGDLVFLVEKKDSPKYQIMRRAEITKTLTPLVTSESPITTVAVSRDGELLVYTVDRVADKANRTSGLTLYLQPLAGGDAVSVPLLPGEHIASVAF